MSNQGLLSEVSHWYPIVHALAALGQLSGPLFITYDDMLARDVTPDVTLYKIIARAAEGNSTAAHTAAFDWWRLLNSRVVPDVELMNSLIRCCEMCGEGERGFMFLGLFEQCQLAPDLDTFDALFKVARVHIYGRVCCNITVYVIGSLGFVYLTCVMNIRYIQSTM